MNPEHDEHLKVRLELFEGPMDLLLYLIKKSHIEITDIPIAEVLHQYLAYLELMRLCDINVASEYLVTAAELIRIKARMLIPQNEGQQEPDEDDPRNALVQQLLEYQKYKEVAGFLGEQEDKFRSLITRQESVQDYRPEGLYIEANLLDLMSAFEKALRDIPKDVFFEVMKDEVTVEERREYIIELISESSRIELTALFRSARSKVEIVATFLAVLELIKMQVVKAVQDAHFADIVLLKNEDGDRRDADALPATEDHPVEKTAEQPVDGTTEV
jgi:segregation and condensation protein A